MIKDYFLFMKVIKNTKSLSPISGKIVDAQIVLEDDKIYINKKDENGKEYYCLIEKDFELYKILSNHEYIAPTLNKFFVNISYECNSSCKLCYAANYENKKNLSLGDIKDFIQKYSKRFFIVLIGKEPTCNHDLPDILKELSRGKNHHLLVTNGIKLADYSYLKNLKQSGLERVVLSFNGFKSAVYETINNADLLKVKLKALENLKKLNIETEIAMTTLRDINQNEILDVINFCLSNLSWIKRFRIRTAATIGNYIEVESLCLSELLKLMFEPMGITRQEIYNALRFSNALDSILKRFLKNSLLQKRLCSATFFLKHKKNKIYLIGSQFKMNSNSSIHVILHLFREVGVIYPVLMLIRVMLKVPQTLPLYRIINTWSSKYFRILPVAARCWPNKFNIDINEYSSCSSYIYDLDNPDIQYCYGNIMQEFRQGH